MIASLQHALRSLRRSPAFSVTVVATLAIGIGLNAAIFTVVDCVLLRPLGYRDADRIVALRTHFVDENRSIAGVGGDDYSDLTRQVKGLEAAAYYHQNGDDGIELNGNALYVPVALVGPAFGQVLSLEPVAGRIFSSTDIHGADAMVSASFARDHFGSAAAALSHTIHYEGVVRPIVGVLPDGFSFPDKTAVWFEDDATPQNPNRTAYNQRAIAKRRAGVSPAQLSAELATFSSQLQNAYPEDRHKTLLAVPLQEQIVGIIRPTLNLLTGAVGIVLLIVCTNITHLQLVRATRQLRTVTIRTALGASRRSLATTALLEALLLATAGCIAAVLLAVSALRLILRVAPPDIPRLAEIHLNPGVLVFSFLISLAVMCLTALLPVWRTWHIDPSSALRQDASRGTEGRGAIKLRNGLIIAEVALTLTLSGAAVLLTRQLIQQSRQDLGFVADNLITLDSHAVDTTPSPTPQQAASATPSEVAAYSANQDRTHLARLDATLDSIASVPGVESTAAISGAPMGFGFSDVSYAVRGRQVFAPGVENLPNANIHPVTPNLFATMKIPLLEGRMLSPEDRLGAPSVLLINRELARRIFPGQDPIGKQIMCGYDADSTWWTIVGVVGDVREDSPAAPPYPTFYVPVAQHPGQAGDMQLVVRTPTDPTAMIETLRNRLHQAHPEIAVKGTTMRENIGESQRSTTFRTLIFASFAAVSLLLAAVGMYGVTAYSVSQRRFEFGLRFALGATRAQVLALVLRNALAVVFVGIALGAALSIGLLHVFALGKLPAFDLTAYALAATTILFIALCATLVPARRASTLDPMTILRSE